MSLRMALIRQRRELISNEIIIFYASDDTDEMPSDRLRYQEES